MFKDAHDLCREGASKALLDLQLAVAEAVMNGQQAADLRTVVTELVQRGRLLEAQANSKGLSTADEACLRLAHTQPVSDTELGRLLDIFELFEPEFLKQPGPSLVKWHGYVSVTFSNTLYQVLHGQLPVPVPNDTGFRLAPDEHVLVLRKATLAEYRSVSPGGTYQSVSLPVGFGMYYRIGAATPRTKQTGLVPVDDGDLLITTHAIYFGGQQLTMRIPYSSILRIESYVDGFGVHENFGSGKVFIPYTLGFDDGWFFYNLVSALSTKTN